MAETRIGQRKFGTREERRAYWRGHVEAWSESEQSKQGYCRAHGLNPASFYRWQAERCSEGNTRVYPGACSDEIANVSH